MLSRKESKLRSPVGPVVRWIIPLIIWSQDKERVKCGGRVGTPVRMAKGFGQRCPASSALIQVLWVWCRHQALRMSVHSSEECLRVRVGGLFSHNVPLGLSLCSPQTALLL